MSTIILLVTLAGVIAVAAWLAQQLLVLRRRVRPIIDVDAEVRHAQAEATAAKNEAADTRARTDSERQKTIEAAKSEAASIVADGTKTLSSEIERLDQAKIDILQATADANAQRKQAEEDAVKRRAELESTYKTAHNTYIELKSQVDLLEENLEDISYGLYKPHYDFATSAEYQKKLDEVYERQKAAIRNDAAVHFGVEWSVGDSRAAGLRMQKQYGKLMLRAFNGECDAAVARVSWSNASKMEERIRKAFDAINSLGGVMQISLTASYLSLQMEELHLTYELEQKKHVEQEEEKRVRARMREEEKVQKELEQARKKAEKEEAEHQAALTKARAELASASQAEIGEMNARIQLLEQQLAQATQDKERAISMAQQTRAGYVYIISNHGSFGDDVLKIGLTRRQDPMERITELGDAAVPFGFDLRGKVYVQDAPALEHEIHRYFDAKRVNLANNRKEFFRISVDEIEAFTKSKGLDIEYVRIPEAREYRETLSRRHTMEANLTGPEDAPVSTASPFPASPFASS